MLFEKEEIASHLQSGPRKNLLELANQIDDFHKGVLDPSTILFGYRASYFQGLSRYAPQVIKKDSENKPVLMLLSEHNSSRNSSDLETIHKILANLEVRKEYLWGLNRVFHTSNHDPPLDEFYPPGFVSPKVIKILKDWILKKNS